MLRVAILFALASTVFWTTTSLAASWWIYNRAHIFELGWLDSALGRSPGKWLNLHVGLDEIAPVLKARFHRESGLTLDIQQANWRSLPAFNQSFDTVFLVLAANEFRRTEARERLFIEVQRVLRDDGRVVVVEHLRDVSNFAVFGPCALTFLSRSNWLRATRAAGLVVVNDRRITPFVHALVFGKQCGVL